MSSSRVIIALDCPDPETARRLIRPLRPELCRLKVGAELFTAGGPSLVRSLVDAGYAVFLDLKFHDIPTTVAKACAAAARLGVWMVNVHAAGGAEMLRAARAAVAGEGHQPLLIGVTVLTSLAAGDLIETGVTAGVAEQVERLARLCRNAGLDGVVCSAQEAARLRERLGGQFILVTPGIRPAGDAAHDQKRTLTPAAAIAAGSHYLVIGRPVTASPDPAHVLEQLNAEINAALAGR